MAKIELDENKTKKKNPGDLFKNSVHLSLVFLNKADCTID
jgi:hypothetical protein